MKNNIETNQDNNPPTIRIPEYFADKDIFITGSTGTYNDRFFCFLFYIF